MSLEGLESRDTSQYKKVYLICAKQIKSAFVMDILVSNNGI